VASLTTLVVVLSGCGSSQSIAPSPARSTPAPNIASFLPSDFRVTATKRVDLDGSATPQVAVTAVGTVQQSTGFAPSTVILLAWDPIAKRWTAVFDASRQPSFQTSTQTGSGTGLVNLTNVGPQVSVIKDQPDGRADLLYWLDSIAGNGGSLLVGIVHYSHQIATLSYNYSGDEGHVIDFDVPSQTPSGASVMGLAPHQQVKVTLPWLTPDDSRSQAARMFSFVIGASTPSYAGYQIVSDDQPYVGVGLSSGSESTDGVVESVDPDSPAAGQLQIGDVITGIAGSALTSVAAQDLNGPVVIEQVALLHPGNSVTLNVIRNGTPLTITIVLAQRNLVSPEASQVVGTTGQKEYLSSL
jgi:hypothetical protein